MENMKPGEFRALGPEAESQERVDYSQQQLNEPTGEVQDQIDSSPYVDTIHEPSHLPMVPQNNANRENDKKSDPSPHRKRIAWKWVFGLIAGFLLGILLTAIVLPPIATQPFRIAIDQWEQAFNDTRQELDISNQDLRNTQQQLTSVNQELQKEKQLYVDLQQIAIEPPYITTSERTVYMVFYHLDRSLIKWQIPFDSLQSSIEEGFIARNPNLGNLSYLRLRNQDTGEIYSVVDFRPFVDSSPFTDVISELYHECDNDGQFISEVWNIVTQLTSYSTIIGEIPRYPLETLLAGGGDCDELSVLFASLIKAAPVAFKVGLIYLDADNPTDPQAVNHVVVKVVEPGGNTHIVETTSNKTMEPYNDGVSGWNYDLGD